MADDSELPHTGISPEWERLLSAIRVRSEAYGTRVSSVIRLGRDNVDFFEQSYDAGGTGSSTQQTASLTRD